MTPAKTIDILRQLHDWLRGGTQWAPTMGAEAVETAIEMIERTGKMEAALRDHHKNAMCEGCDHSHPLTQLRLSAYQQSKLYADTVSVLEELK